jgi:hypothetical protein
MTFHRLDEQITVFLDAYVRATIRFLHIYAISSIILLYSISLLSLHKHTERESLMLAAKQELIHANRKFDCSNMVNTRRKNWAAKGISANAGGIPGEQPSANRPSPRQ